MRITHSDFEIGMTKDSLQRENIPNAISPMTKKALGELGTQRKAE